MMIKVQSSSIIKIYNTKTSTSNQNPILITIPHLIKITVALKKKLIAKVKKILPKIQLQACLLKLSLLIKKIITIRKIVVAFLNVQLKQNQLIISSRRKTIRQSTNPILLRNSKGSCLKSTKLTKKNLTVYKRKKLIKKHSLAVTEKIQEDNQEQ